MGITVIIIGVNEWDRFTSPCIESLKRREPGAKIVLVDNGSNPAYPTVPGVEIVRLNKTVSYAEAINAGLRDDEWVIVTNNDVLFYKPLAEQLEKLDKNNLYGFWEHETNGVKWLSGWCFLIPDEVLFGTGMFDEEFKPMWFEDADYSLRAKAEGFGLVNLDRERWGIEHLALGRSKERLDYIAEHDKAHRKNLAYLVKKHGL